CGDGAGAAIVSNAPAPNQRRVEWKTAKSLLSPEHRDYLRFEQRGGMLRNLLTRQVPALAAKHAARVLADVLAETGAKRDQISAWILHAGGRGVLQTMQEGLGFVGWGFRPKALGF